MGRGAKEYDLAEALIIFAGVNAHAAAERFERDCRAGGHWKTALLWSRVGSAVLSLQGKEPLSQSEAA